MTNPTIRYHDPELYADCSVSPQHRVVVKMEASVTLSPNQHYTAQSCVHVDVPLGMVGLITPVKRFAVREDNRRKGAIRVGANTIHGGYSGKILIDINTVGLDDVELRRGDEVLQIVFLPCLLIDVVV